MKIQLTAEKRIQREKSNVNKCEEIQYFAQRQLNTKRKHCLNVSAKKKYTTFFEKKKLSYSPFKCIVVIQWIYVTYSFRSRVSLLVSLLQFFLSLINVCVCAYAIACSVGCFTSCFNIFVECSWSLSLFNRHYALLAHSLKDINPKMNEHYLFYNVHYILLRPPIVQPHFFPYQVKYTNYRYYECKIATLKVMALELVQLD